MLRKIRYSVLVIFLILICAAVLKDKIFDTPQRCKERIESLLSKSAKNDITANIFNLDKTYVYKMYYWSLVPLGELKFITRVNDLGNIFSFRASTQGNFIEKFVRADAGVESYFSKNIRLPYKYTETTIVNGKTKTKEILFDQVNLITSRGDKRFKIPLNTYDPVSAFVHMLTLPIDQNDREKIKFISGEDVYLLKSTLINESDSIAEILIDMRRENLTSSHGADFHVWLTQDHARIPLLFKSWTPAGYFTVVLDRVSIDRDDQKNK